jgi:hypothetical protein
MSSQDNYILLCSLSLWVYNPLDLGRIFSFLLLHTVGRTPWMGNQPCQKAATYTLQHKGNKRRQRSMPRVGFEPAIPLLERAKTVLAIERAAVLIG